jgi:hypothetical protein
MSSLRSAAMLGLEHLYHYQSFNLDHLREVIVDGVIHFSKPSDFNDPWDCRPWFDFECLSDPKILDDHIKYYIEVSRKLGLISLPRWFKGTQKVIDAIQMRSRRKSANSLKQSSSELMRSIGCTV